VLIVINSLAAKLQSGFEPIQGYFLRDKLGSGGYGEVWSADAPGGLKKAIKFVYGHIDGDRASCELKSLQRIRQVNHPFILSLERIEIIDGQLMIVSELAQGSMFDRYMDFKKKQIAGIPRDRLLSYLADAADGLDFLCQKHDLQHLDVKPGNLLILSDRIKVADFGLVKDLQSTTQSMLSGMTPTYAAPEMFDGRPGRFSDQYSLAIVFQEMLTGELPFRGRTTAQLANEHINRAPDLNPLPPSDRSIIAKALAKRPQQRFSDCRELINALIEAPELSKMEGEALAQARGWSPRMSPNSKLHTQRSSGRSPGTQSPGHGANQFRSQNIITGIPTRSSDHVAVPEVKAELKPNGSKNEVSGSTTERTIDLIVGIGGKGCEVVAATREKTQDDLNETNVRSFIAIDTDHKSLEPLVDRSKPGHLDYGSIVHIPIKSPHYYRSATEHFPQLSRRWVYNIPRSQLTEGVRPLGMLALLDHARVCHDKLLSKIEDIYHSASEDNATIARWSIHIVASASGGTGSAIATEIGFLIRHMTESIKVPVEVELLLLCASPNPLSSADLSSASAISCLIEINHYFKTNGLHSSLPGMSKNVVSKPPFDHVNLLYCGHAGRREDERHSVQEAALYLTQGLGLLREDGKREVDQFDDSIYPWLSTISASNFDMSYILDPRRANLTLMLDNVLSWVKKIDHYTGLNRVAVPVSQLSSKTSEKIEFLVNDLFRACGWNAQAWVRSCMATATTVRKEEKTNSHEALSNKDQSITDRHAISKIPELRSISESLGTNLLETTKAFECQLDDGINRLQGYLCNKWLTQPHQWGLLPSLADYIASKLKIQTNSLFTVAQKLAHQHDNLIEQINSGSTEEESIETNLSRLFIESQFHALAGRLLGRIIQFLEDYQTKWSNFSKGYAKELLGYAVRLCDQELNMSLESFLADMPTPRTDRQAKTSVNWLNSLLVRQWDRYCGTKAWVPDESRWPGIIDEQGLEGTQELLTRILDLLNDNYVSKKPAQTSKPENRKSEEDSTLAACKIIEDLTSTAPHESWNPRSSTYVKSGPDSILELDKRLLEQAPYLVEFGGKNKQILRIPDYIWHQIPIATREALREKCVIQHADGLTEPVLVSVGSDLDLENLVDRLFMPTTETWHLVPRILSRVDVDWIPFSTSD
jgi:serine/threonine protein kinase